MLRNGLAMVLALTATPLMAQGTTGADVARAVYIKTMDQEFGKMDADKNGQVTRAEAEAFQRSDAVARSAARVRGIFTQLDSDRNGQLSFAEFAKTQSGTPPVNAQPFFTGFDSNKDGRVSLVEHRAGKLTYFDRIDTDKDGVVTVAEMKAAGVIK